MPLLALHRLPCFLKCHAPDWRSFWTTHWISVKNHNELTWHIMSLFRKPYRSSSRTRWSCLYWASHNRCRRFLATCLPLGLKLNNLKSAIKIPTCFNQSVWLVSEPCPFIFKVRVFALTVATSPPIFVNFSSVLDLYAIVVDCCFA